jgi:hypothetical protein
MQRVRMCVPNRDATSSLAASYELHVAFGIADTLHSSASPWVKTNSVKQYKISAINLHITTITSLHQRVHYLR